LNFAVLLGLRKLASLAIIRHHLPDCGFSNFDTELVYGFMVDGRQIDSCTSPSATDYFYASSRCRTLPLAWSQAPVVVTTSHQCYGSCTVPVRERVWFKIAGLVHQSLAGVAPAYLANDCRLLSDVGRRPLWSNSNDMRKLLVPLGDRIFSAAGPRVWNDLPPRLWQPGLSFSLLRRSLKTHLFGN